MPPTFVAAQCPTFTFKLAKGLWLNELSSAALTGTGRELALAGSACSASAGMSDSESSELEEAAAPFDAP